MIPYLNSLELKNLVENKNKLLLANNFIYDVTNYYENHPGGNCILKKILNIDKNGRIIYYDCSEDFKFHSKNGKKIWKKLVIGTIKQLSLCEKILMKLSIN